MYNKGAKNAPLRIRLFIGRAVYQSNPHISRKPCPKKAGTVRYPSMSTVNVCRLPVLAVLLLYCSCASQPSSVAEVEQETDSMPAVTNPLTKVESLYDRISRAALIGNYQQAIEAYEEAKLSTPNDLRTQILLARLYITTGEEDTAKELLLTILATNPENPQANAYLGELFLGGGYYSQAEEHFKIALQQEPENLIALQGLGSTYIRTGKEKEAFQTLSDAIAADSHFSYSYMDRAKVQMAQGYYDGAIADADVAIGLDSKNGWHYFDRGRIHARNASFKEAVDDFTQAIVLIPDIFLFYAFRAQMNGLLGNYDLAANDYSVALSLRPDYYPAYSYIGGIEYIRGNYSKAHEYFHRASEHEKFKDPYILFAGISLLAESQFEGRNYLNNNLYLLDREGLLYKIGRFYIDGVDTQVLYGLQREKIEGIKARAQFYLALRYFQQGRKETTTALVASSEQSALDGSPEGLVRDWLINEAIQ